LIDYRQQRGLLLVLSEYTLISSCRSSPTRPVPAQFKNLLCSGKKIRHFAQRYLIAWKQPVEMRNITVLTFRRRKVLTINTAVTDTTEPTSFETSLLGVAGCPANKFSQSISI
jgi:hypothetical protein